MSTETPPIFETLSKEFETYDRQKCFIGYSKNAPWSDDLLSACESLLRRPEFDLEPDYADKHFNSNITLKDKALELIANARYGIYDLSYWRDANGKWQTPRNVFIELGMAIALNRPTLLLRHASNQALELATCLQSVSGYILDFSGQTTLTDVLSARLPFWVKASPDENWWNRNCVFGGRKCEYRDAHPRAKQSVRRALSCHISDGPDVDRPDFRGLISDVLGRFSDLTFSYLSELPISRGYDFLLCSHCQTVRAHPFAIHRLTENTQPETLIAIGISIALEKQFDYKIPKLLLVENPEDLPSLLKGYEYVPARSDKERKEQLRRFLPTVMRQVRETVWKPRRLPFIEFPIPTLASFETITQEPNLDVATSVQQPPEKISDPDLDSRLDKRIGELDLSDLATSCLRDADIRTVRDLVQRTAEDLRGLRKFTRKNLKEVNRALNVLKLRLKASPVKTSGANQYKIRVYDLARELKLDNKKIMEDARREGIAVSVPSNTLPHEVAERIRLKYFPKKIAPQVGPRLVKHAKAVDELLSAGVGGVSATAAEQRFARPEESALPRPNVRVLKAQRPTLEVAKTTSGELSRALSQRPALRDTSSGRDHGTVVEAYPDATFLVRTPEGLEILATVSDKMRNNLITVLPGDTVTLQFARRDSRMARIVYRHRE